VLLTAGPLERIVITDDRSPSRFLRKIHGRGAVQRSMSDWRPGAKRQELISMFTAVVSVKSGLAVGQVKARHSRAARGVAWWGLVRLSRGAVW